MAEITYESLAERLNTELEQARSLATKANELKPGQMETASMIGSTEQIPTGMSPTETISRGTAAADRFVAADTAAGTKNILDVISSMMTLKKNQDVYEQQLIDNQMALREQEFAANEQGMTIYDENGNLLDQPRRMTDAEVEEKGMGGIDSTTQAWLDEIEKGNVKKLTNVPAESRDAVVEALAKSDLTFDEVTRRVQGEGLAATLQPLLKEFLGGEEIGDEMASGRFGGLIRKGKALFGKDASVKVYQDLKEGLLGRIKEFTGDKGVMTDVDAERIDSNMPEVTDTWEEASKKLKIINEIFNKSYGQNLIDPAMLGLEEEKSSGDNEFDSLWKE